jgi:hypothetical protein
MKAYISVLQSSSAKNKMFQDIFLTYANYPLRKYPEKVAEIYTMFNKGVMEYGFEPVYDLETIAEYFVVFVKFDNLARAKRYQEEKNLIEGREWELYEIAFQAIYGQRQDYCRALNWKFNRFRTAPENARFNTQGDLKCYQCDQLFFRHILKSIVDGNEYSEIEPKGVFLELVKSVYRNYNIDVNIVCSDHKLQVKEKIEERFEYLPVNDCIVSPYEMVFYEAFFRDIVFFSFIQFLLKTDRRYLKLCPHCKNYHIVGNLNRKYCSERCMQKAKLSQEERAQYMRRYRKRKLKQRKAETQEEEIRRIQENLDISREEAIELINADKKL